MADPYEKVKGGRLAFKGGGIATVGKSIDKKNKKKRKNKEKHELSLDQEASEFLPGDEDSAVGGGGGAAAAEGSASAAVGGGEIYTIDAAKRLKYDQLFPVEAKKFGYDPKSQVKSVEEALDDRVKKKADRYCK